MVFLFMRVIRPLLYCRNTNDEGRRTRRLSSFVVYPFKPRKQPADLLASEGVGPAEQPLLDLLDQPIAGLAKER